MVPLFLMSVLLALAKPSFQASSVNSKSYVGAVVEFHPIVDGESGQIVAETNADRYGKIIERASAYNVDIIVFPESGITSLPKYGPREEQLNATEFRAFYRDVASNVPSPEESVVPCDVDGKYKESLRKISCAARDFKVYVVANHHERADCPEPNCSRDNFLLYNTNVVFDRNGRVVARYRKYNLYNEAGTNVTALPEYSTFTTDFGVTFGQFICADIIQEKPAKFFVKNPNVTDVVFSTHWFNELPFSDAVQHQAGWSHGANVNFLASNYNRVRTSSGGSGIYAGANGPIVVYHSLEASTALIVAEIPKFKNGKPVDDLQVGKPTVLELSETSVSEEPSFEKNYLENLRLYTTENIDLRQSSVNTTICDRGLCCDFEGKIGNDKGLVDENFDVEPYRYRFLVFNGVIGFEAKNESAKGLEVCALVACSSDRIEDCGNVYPPNLKVAYPTSFLSLKITRQVDPSARSFYEPSTLTLKSRLPLRGKDFSYSEQDESELLMSLAKPQTDLLVFGIWGRRFDRDGQKPTEFVANEPWLV